MTSATTNLQNPSTPEPEDRRTRWLLIFLIAPVFVAPAAAAAAALAAGTDPYPWHTIGNVFATALAVAEFVGLAVLVVPRLSTWFGTPNIVTPRDERETAIFDRSLLVAFTVAMGGLFAVGLATGSTTMFVLIGLTATTFYLSMLYNSRRI